MEKFQPLPGDSRAGAIAHLAGGIGIATFIALALMYGLELPRPAPRIFGPLSDIGSGLFALLAIPVIMQLHRRLPRSQWAKTALVAFVFLSVAGAAGSFLLVAKVLDFATATALAMLALCAQAVWLVGAHSMLLNDGAYPRKLARRGRLVGMAFLIGVAAVAAGFLVPAGWVQWAVFGTGGLIGLAGWLGMPFWFFMAGRRLIGSGVTSAPPAAEPLRHR